MIFEDGDGVIASTIGVTVEADGCADGVVGIGGELGIDMVPFISSLLYESECCFYDQYWKVYMCESDCGLTDVGDIEILPLHVSHASCISAHEDIEVSYIQFQKSLVMKVLDAVIIERHFGHLLCC